jgi:hypothetical protein
MFPALPFQIKGGKKKTDMNIRISAATTLLILYIASSWS